MALKVDYIARETTTNLRRNLTLTLAAIVTVGVALGLAGSAFLLQYGVSNVSGRWEEDIELIVFLQRDITDDQRDALQASLDGNAQVERVRYVNEKDSRDEALRLFERNDAMLKKIREDETWVPPSFRIVPVKRDTGSIEALQQQLSTEPGVFEVSTSLDAVETVTNVANFARKGIFAVSLGLLVAALMLILNTIRMAMFARRREIEVMKLVGATNWFIRVPFMLEGVIQGAAGAAFALGGLTVVDRFMERVATNDEYRLILGGLVASRGEVIFTMIAVVLVGALIGALGSLWAISRFLKV